MILEPLETETDKYKTIYKEIQKKINALYDNGNVDSMTYDDFLKDVIEMTEKEYIKVIRSTLNGPKVFLKRTPCESIHEDCFICLESQS
jgi:hypothetical protein